MTSRLDVILCALGAVILLSLFLVHGRPSEDLGDKVADRATFAGVFVSATLVTPELSTANQPALAFEVLGESWDRPNSRGWAFSRPGMAVLTWRERRTWPGHVLLVNRDPKAAAHCNVAVYIDEEPIFEEMKIGPGEHRVVPSLR